MCNVTKSLNDEIDYFETQVFHSITKVHKIQFQQGIIAKLVTNSKEERLLEHTMTHSETSTTKNMVFSSERCVKAVLSIHALADSRLSKYSLTILQIKKLQESLKKVFSFFRETDFTLKLNWEVLCENNVLERFSSINSKLVTCFHKIFIRRNANHWQRFCVSNIFTDKVTKSWFHEIFFFESKFLEFFIIFRYNGKKFEMPGLIFCCNYGFPKSWTRVGGARVLGLCLFYSE